MVDYNTIEIRKYRAKAKNNVQTHKTLVSGVVSSFDLNRKQIAIS